MRYNVTATNTINDNPAPFTMSHGGMCDALDDYMFCKQSGFHESVRLTAEG